VGYDSNKSLYYAYSDGVQLAPQETRVFEVHLEDIWKIQDAEVNKVRTQTDLALKHLEKTEHYPQAKAIVDSIDRRLNEIVVRQNDDTLSREDHIGAYRLNVMTMDQIKEDIALIEKMLMTTGGEPSIEFLKDTKLKDEKDLDKITAWKLILGVIAFLGLLGFGFYLKWFLAIKSRKGSRAEYGDEAPMIGENVDDPSGLRSSSEIDVSKLLNPDKDNKRKTG
jgi:hypothetical protein